MDHDTGPLAAIAAEAWQCLGEDPGPLAEVVGSARPAHLPSVLPAADLASASVCVLVAQAMTMARDRRMLGSGQSWPPVDPGRVATSFRSDQSFRWNDQPPSAWGALSGFWRTSDGWLRTHANYPHHAARLRRIAGLPQTAGPDEAQAVFAGRTGAEWEDLAAAEGAVAVTVRTPEQWQEHPQARAVADRPLLEFQRLATPAGPGAGPGDGTLPLTGTRVLDLTRVIAGPVAARTLGYLGAEVLRIDPPLPAELEWQHLDTGQGKRSATLDLSVTAHRARLGDLLSSADVLITGYRPASLDRFGLSAQELSQRYPGLIIGRLSAWGGTGPWQHRRGFDSIVQAASGIAHLTSPGGDQPGALPAQVLDHSAGYFLAGATIAALRRRAAQGSGHLVSVHLARIAQTLLTAPGRHQSAGEPDPTGFLRRATGPAGKVTYAAPAFTVPEATDDYRWAGTNWGADAATWD